MRRRPTILSARHADAIRWARVESVETTREESEDRHRLTAIRSPRKKLGTPPELAMSPFLPPDWLPSTHGSLP
jgi:hypothetical protein